MNPLHAAYYPDQAVHENVLITQNVRLAKDTYRVRFESPQIARRIVPGQFLMLRLADVNDPLIGRPLALYDTVYSGFGEPEAIWRRIDHPAVLMGRLVEWFETRLNDGDWRRAKGVFARHPCRAFEHTFGSHGLRPRQGNRFASDQYL